jgi:hypothetical protein
VSSVLSFVPFVLFGCQPVWLFKLVERY